MLRHATFGLTLLSTLLFSVDPAFAASKKEKDSTPINSVKADQAITSTLYSPAEILETPSLQSLLPIDPEHNKIVFSLENFPKFETFTLEVKRLKENEHEGNESKSFDPLFTFHLEDNGIIATSNQEHLKDLYISAREFLPGERVTFRFKNDDQSFIKEITGIPNPAFFKDKTGTIRLTAELVSISPTVYTISMPTLKDGDKFTIRTVIIGHTTTAKAVYDSKVPYHFAPSVKKVNGGDSHFEIATSDGDVYFLKLPWGTALESHPKERKLYRPVD